jgi:hypothetical protein
MLLFIVPLEWDFYLKLETVSNEIRLIKMEKLIKRKSIHDSFIILITHTHKTGKKTCDYM